MIKVLKAAANTTTVIEGVCIEGVCMPSLKVLRF